MLAGELGILMFSWFFSVPFVKCLENTPNLAVSASLHICLMHYSQIPG